MNRIFLAIIASLWAATASAQTFPSTDILKSFPAQIRENAERAKEEFVKAEALLAQRISLMKEKGVELRKALKDPSIDYNTFVDVFLSYHMAALGNENAAYVAEHYMNTVVFEGIGQGDAKALSTWETAAKNYLYSKFYKKFGDDKLIKEAKKRSEELRGKRRN